jgi:predicted enzyme related to lactoylglutathione lyase
MGYGVIDNGGEGINGGIGPSRDGSSRVTFYMAVDDPDAYLHKVEARGGETVMETTELPGLVTLAQLRDPGGHVVGLVKSS